MTAVIFVKGGSNAAVFAGTADAASAGASAAAAAASAASISGVVKIARPAGFVGGVQDNYGRYFMAVRANGSVVFPQLEATFATISNATFGGATLQQKAPRGYSYGWSDQYGRFVGGFRNDGTFVTANMADVQTINGTPLSGFINASPTPVLDAEINMFTCYGQSRANGTQAAPVLTTAQLYDGLRFNDGVRPFDQVSPTRSSLVALIETDNGLTGTSELAETPCSGMEAGIKQLLVAENAIAYTDRPYQMLMVSEARGGTPISGLQSGTAPFNAIKADIDAMRTLAQAAGKTSKYRGFSWSHGESDYQAATSAATYRSALTATLSGLDTYAKTGNPANGDVRCFIDQVFAHATYGFPNNPYLALEQLAITEDTANFYMVGNFANLPISGYPHPTNAGAQWMGAYFSRAYKRVVIEGGNWQPLKPVEWYRDGNVVMLRFSPESGQLALDGSTGTTNSGLTMVDSGGAAITISSVTLIGKDMLKVVAAAPIAAGAKIRNGFVNGKTGIRDTMGASKTVTIGSNTYALHNWCVIFEKTLS